MSRPIRLDAAERADKGARVATSVEEIRRIVAGDELAVVLHFQGSAPLGGQVDMVDTYARLGVRLAPARFQRR